MRKTLIFGNGLGMALDPNYFNLKAAINCRWNNDEIMSQNDRRLIAECMPSRDRPPNGEEDLEVLQKVLSACEFLSALGDREGHWLSEHGKQFPASVREFVYLVALYFHEYSIGLPEKFLDPLREFIRSTSSHVATLNYDPLLYSAFADSDIFNGFSGYLIDGFLAQGFAPENMRRKKFRKDQLGFYLHLHGSPLFVNHQGIIRKINRGERESVIELLEFLGGSSVQSDHLVLTHFDYKSAVINSSQILSYYWSVFEKSISESQEIVLFGYSGRDKHLNSVVRRSEQGIPIRVVEWSGEIQYGMNGKQLCKRSEFWRRTLGREVQVVSMDNVLDFTDW